MAKSRRGRTPELTMRDCARYLLDTANNPQIPKQAVDKLYRDIYAACEQYAEDQKRKEPKSAGLRFTHHRDRTARMVAVTDLESWWLAKHEGVACA